jgi:hypothetical protein
MEKFYDIKKIKIVLYRPPVLYALINEYENSAVKQLVYVDGGSIIDIFGEKYISGLYYDGNMPAFYYDPVNYLHHKYFTDFELKKGIVSEKRLLEIYCELNNNFIKHEEALRQDEFRDNKSIIDISRHKIRRLLLKDKNNGKRDE